RTADCRTCRLGDSTDSTEKTGCPRRGERRQQGKRLTVQRGRLLAFGDLEQLVCEPLSGMAGGLFANGLDLLRLDLWRTVSPVLPNVGQHGGNFIIAKSVPPRNHDVGKRLAFHGHRSLEAVEHDPNNSARLFCKRPVGPGQRGELSRRSQPRWLVAGRALRFFFVNKSAQGKDLSAF